MGLGWHYFSDNIQVNRIERHVLDKTDAHVLKIALGMSLCLRRYLVPSARLFNASSRMSKKCVNYQK